MSELPETQPPPSAGPTGYDDRYLAGIACFNRGEYFDAHEVWEDLWMDCPSADRRFFQSLIQAAVSLYHWGNGNRAGADRLFHSGKRYMEPYRPKYRGLDVTKFWNDVELAQANRDRQGAGESATHPLPNGRRSPILNPTIALDPPPTRWPEPTEVHHE